MVDGRKAIALAVTNARLAKGWGKEEAARRAGVSSITWKRVEDGQNVQDAKLAAVLGALGLTPDDMNDAAQEVSEVESAQEIVHIARQVATDYLRSGGEPERAADLIAAAVARRDALIRYDIDPEIWNATHEAKDGSSNEPRDPAPMSRAGVSPAPDDDDVSDHGYMLAARDADDDDEAEAQQVDP